MKSVLITPDNPLVPSFINVLGVDAVVIEEGCNGVAAGAIDDDVYVADYIISNIPDEMFYREFGTLYRFISRAIDHNLSKIVMSVKPSDSDNVYRPHLEKTSDGKWMYDIAKRYAEIDQLAMTHNILPFDTYESLPVTHSYGNTPEKYGCIVELDIPQIDPEKLRNSLDTYINNEKPHYVSDRFDTFLVPAPEIINYLRRVGFTTEKYASHPLNIRGTATMSSDIPEYAKFVYNQLESPLFRHNYVIGRNGWKTTWHKDHATPVVHGFRLMVPIDPVIMDFEKGRYILTPGKYYFVNNSLLHRGVIPDGLTRRANLLAQMASDVDILRGTVVF